MTKKLYIRVTPKKQDKLDALLDETMTRIKDVPNVDKVKGQIGLVGDEKHK
jgi:hypothetical protein